MSPSRRNVTTLHGALVASALGLAIAAGGCGGAAGEATAGLASSALTTENGFIRNGFTRNGFTRNGFIRNGFTRNGLSAATLATAEFQAWFDEDPATSDEVMTYTVRCAAPAGASLAWTDPATGVAYAWSGLLGLAPGWASGQPATTAEQQVITACLAAHVNKYGQHMLISVRGVGATGVAIPYDADERTSFDVPEAAFFGNVFAGEGVYVCLDHKPWNKKFSSARACGFDSKASGMSDCSPIAVAGECDDVCADRKVDRDRRGYYTACAVGGVTYRPITTQLSADEVYTCGDGVCQFTESCGTGKAYDSCGDCGPCPDADE